MTRRTTQFLTFGGVVAVALLVIGASRAIPAPASRLALPGDLPKPLGQMTSGELWDVGQRLGYDNGPVQGRNCARGACMGRVDAVREQVAGPGNISPNGTIVARLMNLGRQGSGDDDGPENIYRTERDGSARFYIVAVPVDGGWRWSVRKAVRNDGNAPVETAAGNWVTCRHDRNNPAHPKGRSEFARCPGPQGGAGGLFPPNDPAWVECSDGCCTAGIF
jgi:hypothetical protein